MKTYNLTEAKAKLSCIISRVTLARERVAIRRKREGLRSIKGSFMEKGLQKSEPDLRIAAIAIQHKMVLVTGNKRHFVAIPGLTIEDWTVGD